VTTLLHCTGLYGRSTPSPLLSLRFGSTCPGRHATKHMLTFSIIWLEHPTLRVATPRARALPGWLFTRHTTLHYLAGSRSAVTTFPTTTARSAVTCTGSGFYRLPCYFFFFFCTRRTRFVHCTFSFSSLRLPDYLTHTHTRTGGLRCHTAVCGITARAISRFLLRCLILQQRCTLQFVCSHARTYASLWCGTSLFTF